MRTLKLFLALIAVGASAIAGTAQSSSCSDSARTRAFSAIDRSLFRVTAFDETTGRERLLGTATLVTLSKDPSEIGIFIGHFITASHLFEGDGLLPRAGRTYTGTIGLRPCSSLPNEPESGVSGVTEVYHRISLQEPDLSVLRARIDADLLLTESVSVATLFVGSPRSIRLQSKSMAYAGFPANAPDEIAPFSSSVTDLRYIPELKKPWALMGVTKTPDEGQSGSPLFGYDRQAESATPTIFGLVVEVPTRNEVITEQLADSDHGWVTRAFQENSVVLVQPIELSSPIIAMIPAGSWVERAISDIRRNDPAALRTRLRKDSVKQPAVDLAYFLKALRDDSATAKAAAKHRRRISDFLVQFSTDAASEFLEVTSGYLRTGGGEAEIQNFVSAELGRRLLSEMDDCIRETRGCPNGATDRQIGWMRQNAIKLIEADATRIDVGKVQPGSQAGRYLANLHLDLAKALRQAAKSKSRFVRNLEHEQRSLDAAVTLNPESAQVYGYAGDFLKETKRPVTAAASFLVAATNVSDTESVLGLRERCDASVQRWSFQPKGFDQDAIRKNAPGLYSFIQCDPPKDGAERQIAAFRQAVKEALGSRSQSRDIAAERAELIYREKVIISNPNKPVERAIEKSVPKRN